MSYRQGQTEPGTVKEGGIVNSHPNPLSGVAGLQPDKGQVDRTAVKKCRRGRGVGEVSVGRRPRVRRSRPGDEGETNKNGRRTKIKRHFEGKDR